MVSDYGGLNFYDKKYYIPEFQERTENIIKFEGEGATQDLQIEIMKDGIIKVSSYDCT